MSLSFTCIKLRFCSVVSFFDSSFITNTAEYTGTVRNLYCEGDSLLKKTTCPGFFPAGHDLSNLIQIKSQCYVTFDQNVSKCMFEFEILL